jgi:hypothetical protein
MNKHEQSNAAAKRDAEARREEKRREKAAREKAASGAAAPPPPRRRAPAAPDEAPADDFSLHMLAYLAPPPDESLAEWSERVLVLSPRQPTPFPGAFRLSRTPYLRGIMDALDDPAVRLVVVEAGAQTGKTTTGYAWLAHCAATDPGPALVVYPSEDLARSNSQSRIQPLFEDSPELAAILPADRRANWTLLSYRLGACTIHLSGANSPAQLASRPVRYLLLDEVDKYPAEATRGEADAVSLAMQRTKTFWNAKVLMVSTPTTPAGAIHRHFSRGDQCEYHVPCPLCGEPFALRWQHVRWPDGDPSAAHVVCPSCGAPWSEPQRLAAVAAGRWAPSRAEGDAEPGVRSFHLSSLLAGWTDLGALARKFIAAKSDPLALRDFVNSDLAEPYVPADAKIGVSEISRREGPYDFGALRWPALDADGAPSPVLGGVDVQLDCFVVVLRQFRADGSSAQVWRGTPRSFAEIAALMDRYDVPALAIDSRYRTAEVLRFALDTPGVLPVKGVASFRMPRIFEAQTSDPYGGRAGTSTPITSYMANSDALLDMLAARVRADDGAPSWEVPRGAGADRDYVRQMTALYRANGRWINPGRLPDHYADAEKYVLLAAAVLGIGIADPAPQGEEGEEQ